ncbi:MAG: ACT domain-containing protein [Bacteroidota bacterium]
MQSGPWHIIHTEFTTLNKAGGTYNLVHLLSQQAGSPVLLLSQYATDTCPGKATVQALLDTINGIAVHTIWLAQHNTSNAELAEQLDGCPADTVPIFVAPCTDQALAGEQLAAKLVQTRQAQRLTLLTEAPGIWSAPPALADDAFILQNLSFQEAAELAFTNSEVLHPQTLMLLQPEHLTICVHALDGESSGTKITNESGKEDGLARGITAQTGLSLIAIEGLGMTGVPGITAHAFSALAAADINLVLLSQASTEQSIGIVIKRADKTRALDLLEKAFAPRLAAGEVSRIYALDDVGIVTVVDDHMRYRPGLTGSMFSTLGRSGINVLTIADGASESNLSAVVAGEDVAAAVQALHEAFCFGRRVAHVFMFGVGTIGGKLLKLMEQQAEAWLSDLNLKISLVGLSNSRHMIWNKRGIPFNRARDTLLQAEDPLDVQAIFKHLIESRLDRLIVIDATASDAIAKLYPDLLEHNIAVVTPNKRANTQSVAAYQRLQTAARDHQVPYFYETTVGAGLPVISTLRDLMRSGDELIQIEGVVSGTLSFLFNQMGDGKSFAEALELAYDSGFTEPDPRDDLSGEDVARKMLILAREAGMMVERDAVEISPLLPDKLMALSREAFMDTYPQALVTWQPDIPVQSGQKIHYVGRITADGVRIGLQALDANHPFAALHGTDNMIIFKTRRYFDNPLIIRGPGAGPAVTAGGVLADLIKAAELVT